MMKQGRDAGRWSRDSHGGGKGRVEKEMKKQIVTRV